jgi:hypothetical protein
MAPTANRNVTLLALLAARLGQRVRASGGLGGECVDWSNLYIAECYGLPHVFRNAVDWSQIRLSGFTWVFNTPTNSPSAGSVVVWHAYPPLGIGLSGHVAVAVASDVMHLLSADQNWPEGAPVSLVVHTYAGIVGWHAPPGK